MPIIKNVLLIPEANYTNFYQPYNEAVKMYICVLCDTHSISGADRKRHFTEKHLIKED